MSTTKGTVFATSYGIDLTREQALHLNDLDKQSFDYNWYNIDEYLTLSSQLDKLDGIYDTNYDLMFVYEGVTFRLDIEDDTDENWVKINKTIQDYLARELAPDPDEDESE
jgi:hypothetical protein